MFIDRNLDRIVDVRNVWTGDYFEFVVCPQDLSIQRNVIMIEITKVFLRDDSAKYQIFCAGRSDVVIAMTDQGVHIVRPILIIVALLHDLNIGVMIVDKFNDVMFRCDVIPTGLGVDQLCFDVGEVVAICGSGNIGEHAHRYIYAGVRICGILVQGECCGIITLVDRDDAIFTKGFLHLNSDSGVHADIQIRVIKDVKDLRFVVIVVDRTSRFRCQVMVQFQQGVFRVGRLSVVDLESGESVLIVEPDTLVQELKVIRHQLILDIVVVLEDTTYHGKHFLSGAVGFLKHLDVGGIGCALSLVLYSVYVIRAGWDCPDDDVVFQ